MKVNLHAPGCGRTTTHESLAGALEIPELMPPNRRRTFKVIAYGKSLRSVNHNHMGSRTFFLPKFYRYCKFFPYFNGIIDKSESGQGVYVMNAEENIMKIRNLIADIEDQLKRSQTVKLSKSTDFPFKGDMEKFLKEEVTAESYVMELLEKYGKRRFSGKPDTAYFYARCNLSAAGWSNFKYGKYTKETLLKLIPGLECNLAEAERILNLAGYQLTDGFTDRLVRAAILSGHNNIDDMFEILEYYSEQYPDKVKNYLKAKKDKEDRERR